MCNSVSHKQCLCCVYAGLAIVHLPWPAAIATAAQPSLVCHTESAAALCRHCNRAQHAGRTVLVPASAFLHRPGHV
jgi:hypothetical protein